MERKRIIRQVLSVLLAMVLVLSGSLTAVTSYAYDAPADVKTIHDIPADLTGKTVILHSNDVHGAIGLYPYIASFRGAAQKSSWLTAVTTVRVLLM